MVRCADGDGRRIRTSHARLRHVKTNDDEAGLMSDRAIFQDERGRGWLVEIQYGHPAPTELGIYAARFVCPEDEAEPVRVGFVEIGWVENGDEAALRAALAESDPARAVG